MTLHPQTYHSLSVAWLVHGAALTTFSSVFGEDNDFSFLSTKLCCSTFNEQATCQYLRGSAGKSERDSLLGTVVTRSNGFKLRGNLGWVAGRSFLLSGALRCWNKLSKEVVDASTLALQKASLDKT